MGDYLDPEDINRIRENAHRKATRKHHKPKPPLPALVPTWQNPTIMPEHADPILKRTKLTRKQFSRYAEQVLLFMASNFTADSLIALQGLIRSGERWAIETQLKTLGILKNEGGVTVNLNQQNLQLNAGGDNHEVDSLIRMLDDRERRGGNVIDVIGSVDTEEIQ